MSTFLLPHSFVSTTSRQNEQLLVPPWQPRGPVGRIRAKGKGTSIRYLRNPRRKQHSCVSGPGEARSMAPELGIGARCAVTQPAFISHPEERTYLESDRTDPLASTRGPPPSITAAGGFQRRGTAIRRKWSHGVPSRRLPDTSRRPPALGRCRRYLPERSAFPIKRASVIAQFADLNARWRR